MGGYEPIPVDVQRLTVLRDNQSTLQNLSKDAWLKAYRNELLPDRLDVLAVSSAIETTTAMPKNTTGFMIINASSLLSHWPDNVPITSIQSFPEAAGGWIPYKWTCTQTLLDGCSNSSPTQNWTVFGSPVDYCLSQHSEPSCKLPFGLIIMIVVILCNLQSLFA